MKPQLTITTLCLEAADFAAKESIYDEPSIYGVTDGKAIGTYLKQKFTNYLALLYNFTPGNSALGIDIASLEVDIKVTSIRQPQWRLQYSLVIQLCGKVEGVYRLR